MKKWQDDVFKRACELRDNRVKHKEIAKILNNEFGTNLSDTAVRRKFQNTGVTNSEPSSLTSVDVKADGSQTSTIKLRMTSEQSKSPEYVLKAHGYNADEWEIIQLTNNVWEQNNSEQGLVQLYQSKIVVKPKVKAFDMSAFTKSINPVKLNTIKTGKRNLFIPIADWHFGITKLADVTDKLEQLVEIVSKGYDTIVIGQLGDLFHSSQIKKSVTMAGTQLDDVNMEQAILDARAFFDVLITECIRHSRQTVIEHAEGNHDGNLQYMFLIYLEAKYPDAVVHYHNNYRQAFMLGNVAIMITHGQYGKRKDLPMLFATEFTDMWARANTREIFSGHFHTQQTNDYQGVIHRQLGTIKPNDSYEVENGWTMGKKVLQVFEYDSDRLRVTYDV